MTRPLAVPAPHLLLGGLCGGLSLSCAVRGSGAAVAVAALAAGGLALGLGPARTALLLLSLGLAGWWWGSLRLEAIDRSVLAPRAGESAYLGVVVTGPARRGPFAVRLPVRVRTIGRVGVDEPAELELPLHVRAPPQGSVVELAARLRTPRGPDGGDGFDEVGYLGRRGVHVVLIADGYRAVGRRGGLGGLADRIRSGLAASIAPSLTGERRALVAGVVLGEDAGLDATLRDRFRASGLYHILAVSGQNVAYVVAGVLLVGWLLGVSRAASQVFALAAIVAYVLAVGWQPSVVRAGVAGGLASLAWLASRAGDRWYFLLVGAAVLLAWNPYSLLEPGFQLSFSAVAAIFVVVPRLERGLEGWPVPRALAAVVCLSAGCGLVTAPILWLHFGAVPVLSVLANALAAPVVAPILGLGLLAATLGVVLPEIGVALAAANGWLAAYLAWCARTIGGLPFAQVDSGHVLVALAAAPAVVWAVRRRPAWRRPVLVLLLAVTALAAGWKLWPRGPALPPPAGLRIAFLDVGQGDATLVQVPEGALLVDQGPPEAEVARELRSFGVRRLAALVLTHPQRDHVGGAADVLRSLRVDMVLDPLLPVENRQRDEAVGEAERRQVPLVAARAGREFRLGRLGVRILWPEEPGTPADDPNDRAVVLLASYGETDVLLTADAESNVTGRLDLSGVEVVKVAHHGSADAGLPVLLERLRPRVAVVSVGRGNDYGHPAASTLAALAGVDGMHAYRTDRDGTVVVESDGRALAVRSER